MEEEEREAPLGYAVAAPAAGGDFTCRWIEGEAGDGVEEEEGVGPLLF